MRQKDGGLSLLELMFVMAVAGTLAAIAVPATTRALDDFRTRSAARYMAQQIARARTEAIKRSAFVGLRFMPVGVDYAYATYVDGNADGIRAADVADGTDLPLASAERLAWHFAGVRFGIAPGVPDADNRPVSSGDGVHVGSSRILSISPNGSATPGTLYIVSAQATQYAVRVLGATGRARVLKYDRQTRQWIEQ
jgi:prepilin-type N-terminal cleavage/methylation domain-containing protein